MCFDTRFPAKCHAHKSSYSKSLSMVLLGVPSTAGPACTVSSPGHSSLVTPTTRHTWYMLDRGRAEQSRRLALRAQLATHQRKSRTLREHQILQYDSIWDCFSVSTLHAQLPFRETESGDGWMCDCDGDLCPASNDEEKRLPETRLGGLFLLDIRYPS
jgi:hypothetical protein